MDRYIIDDAVSVEPPDARRRLSEVREWLQGHLLPEITRGGAYRNRSGELVTWDASADGSYVTVSTWPGE